MTTTTQTRPSGADWLRATEQEIEAFMNEETTRRAEEAERQEREEAYVEAFCTTGFGHADIEYVEADYAPEVASNSGIYLPRTPAHAVCTECGTVLR